jgi:protein-L-isoaspartate(D-aspartate) O-methyltransferase
VTARASETGERRHLMVEEQLVRRGIRDEDVLAAMRSVPRHLFVPQGLAPEAYADSPLPIGHGQTISQPYMVALMTSLLKVDVRSRVLEIGSGSGYQTAVLAELAGEVYAIERLVPLEEGARATLARLGYHNTHTVIGDGTQGWREEAPFDAILVAAAAPEAPPPLLEQLADGGRLVIPLGRPSRDQRLMVYERNGDGIEERSDTRCRFVPLVPDKRREVDALAPPRAATPPRLRRAAGEEVAMKSVSVRVYGRVQSVYYRASARMEGERLGLRGWARNASDGSVALHLQGDPAVVDAMLAWCRGGPPAARVSRVEVADAVADEGLSGFEVR